MYGAEIYRDNTDRRRFLKLLDDSERRVLWLFAERYSLKVVESEEYLFEACAYVVLNPVKAYLCDRVEDWPWSYCAYGLDAA